MQARALSAGRCDWPHAAAASLLACWLGGGVAHAADASGHSAAEWIFLAQIVALILVGRLLGEAMNRIGQPSVMGMLLGGMLLGPSLLGALWPQLQRAIFPPAPEQKAMLDGISQFGILLLLLLTGMETDLKLVRSVLKPALTVSLTGVAVPFLCGFALGQFMPDSLLPDPDRRLLTSLFLGTALSISSIKILAAIVREMNFTRRNLGQIIIASAICEDSIGWIIIAITFGLAQAGTVDSTSVAKSLLGTAVFLGVSLTVGRRLVFFLIRWSNDTFESDFPVITTIVVIMGLMALTTYAIGLHTVLGAFIAGVLIGQSPILTKQIDAQLRGLIAAFFMPIFFGAAGLSADLSILKDPSLALLAIGLIAIASFGKFAGAFLGAAVGGLTRRKALALACGMNARGSTEVIVASIGLSMGALSQSLFTMIVAMALATTLAMPPMLRAALSRVPMSRSEQTRLARERIEAKGFVANLERLLLAVDESPNGKFAVTLAGMIAAPRGLPTTVLPLQIQAKAASGSAQNGPAPQSAGPDRTEELLKAAADTTRRSQDEVAPPSSVIVREPEDPPGQAVAQEARKGYGLLFIGTDNTRAASGGFHREVARIAAGFEGPLALVTGAADTGQLQVHPAAILVPVAGTEVSRRAAEFAVAIARACGSRVTALYVADTAGTRHRARRSRPRREEQAILRQIVDMAGHYGVKATSLVHSAVAPDEAILAEARKHDLLIMGVHRRPGETLFFGDTAAAVFEHAKLPIVFVAT